MQARLAIDVVKSNPVPGRFGLLLSKAALLPLPGRNASGPDIVRLQLKLPDASALGWSPASKTVLSRALVRAANIAAIVPSASHKRSASPSVIRRIFMSPMIYRNAQYRIAMNCDRAYRRRYADAVAVFLVGNDKQQLAQRMLCCRG